MGGGSEGWRGGGREGGDCQGARIRSRDRWVLRGLRGCCVVPVGRLASNRRHSCRVAVFDYCFLGNDPWHEDVLFVLASCFLSIVLSFHHHQIPLPCCFSLFNQYYVWPALRLTVVTTQHPRERFARAGAGYVCTACRCVRANRTVCKVRPRLTHFASTATKRGHVCVMQHALLCSSLLWAHGREGEWGFLFARATGGQGFYIIGMGTLTTLQPGHNSPAFDSAE